jgi:ABC-type glycerol-3-phosphate transport system substrate-binding protein
MYRHSLLDLVEGGNTWDDVVAVAKALREAGVPIHAFRRSDQAADQPLRGRHR